MSRPPLRPVLRVLTAAWPSRSEPRRARFLETLHRQIAARFETEVIAPLVHETDPGEERRHAIAIERFSYPSGGTNVKARGIGPGDALAYCASLALTARRRWSEPARERERGGGVLAHWVVPVGWIAAGVAARLRLPLFLYAHGSDVNVFARSRLGRFLLRRAVRRAAILFVASEALADSIRALVPEPPPIVVLPVGVEAVFHRSDTPPTFDGVLRVLFVGDPIEAKGVELVARAVGICRDRGLAVELEWIGGTVEAVTESIGTASGDLDAGEVAEAMRGAHLLLLPSRNEGTPLVLQEAIISALPWAATPVGGIPALEREYRGGTLLPGPDEPERVVEAIVALIAEWLEAGEAGVRARWQAMANQDPRAIAALGVEARASIFADRVEAVLRCAS